MDYNFDALPNRRNSNSAKWNSVDGDELPLWIADMDFYTPPEVTEVLQRVIEHGVFGYPTEKKEHKQAVVDWLSHRHSWQVSVEDVFFVSGVVNGFNLAAQAVAANGEGVLVQTPTYHHFYEVAENGGFLQHETKMVEKSDGKYEIDFDEFEAAIKPETKVFMLCNPQNPTGRVFSENELMKLAEVCIKRDITIVSDEIHQDIVYSEYKHVPIASLGREIARQTITLVAPSKTFNLAGFKTGVAVIQNPMIRENFVSAQKGLAVHFINLIGLEALKAAYELGESWLDSLLPYLEENRDYLDEYVRSRLPGVKMRKPEGTYLAWLDCRGLGLEEPAGDFFRNQAKVVLSGGEQFGKAGEGFVRFNFASPRTMIAEALERIELAIRG